MKLFFGKITKPKEQFDLGYYLHPKGPSYYGELSEVDFQNEKVYVFIFFGDKVELWKPIGWVEGDTKLQFEKVLTGLPFNRKTFPSFKYLTLDYVLAVMTSRVIKGKAFFPIKFDPTLTEQVLTDPNTYSNTSNFRMIEVHESIETINRTNSYNLILYKEGNQYRFQPGLNIAPDFTNSFKDNTTYVNGNRPQKNKIYKKILKLDRFPVSFDAAGISIGRFYDAFFCDYKDKPLLEEPEEADGGGVTGGMAMFGNQVDDDYNSLPKNIILYGPPGTGKTYNSIPKALEIIDEDFEPKETYTDDEWDDLKTLYDGYRENGQIEFVTFHQNYSYEDFMVGLKPDVSRSELLFLNTPGIFYQIADRARNEYYSARQQEFAYGLKRYVIIIDEINRANISRVFGELITLLEDDKRLGEKHELKITLPNGEKNFALPPNLYVIGTMNTADKSIALVDIALRRRFTFIGKYPNYGLLDKSKATFLESLNAAIYTEKNSADYLIGHAYLLKPEPLESIIEQKIIPLLMEYFNGKTKTVEAIFEKTRFEVKYNIRTFSWDVTPKIATPNVNTERA